MKKILAFCIIAVLLLAALSQVALPRIASGALERELKTSLKTDTVSVRSDTFPAFMMLFGRIGAIDAQVERGMLGNLCAARLTLHGENVKMPSDVLIRNNFAVTDADVLTLEGTVTAEDLADFLNREVKQIEDTKVVITKDLVLADATTKFMGRSADVHIEGVFFVNDNKIALRLTNVRVKKIFFGNDLTANFFDKIDIYDFSKLNMPVELDSAEHRDGFVVLKASRHPGKVYGDGRKPGKGGKT